MDDSAVAFTVEIPKQAPIRFENVSFRYPGTDTNVLENLDLTIDTGETLAIVGENGSGKSTLIKLLGRMYQPTSGRITYGGVDIASIDADVWRHHLAVVFQDFTRFELSVAENVGLSELGHVDLARVRRAVDRAVAHHDAERGLGELLTRRFEGGIELSGGQWQRIVLARVLYAIDAGRDMVILDEPTANLDVRSELRLFESLSEQTGEATVIFLSHRFSTVRAADRIVVLEDGDVSEAGSHDELMALEGRYSEMFRQQASTFGAEA